MAFWISVACLPASGSLEYFRVMPWSFAACSAPFRILSQKVSPGASWVTMARVHFFPSDELFCAPPWLLHAATARRAANTAATTESVRSDLREGSIFNGLSSLQAAGREANCDVPRKVRMYVVVQVTTYGVDPVEAEVRRGLRQPRRVRPCIRPSAPRRAGSCPTAARPRGS